VTILPDAAVVARLRAAGCVFAEDEAELLVAAAPTAVALDGLVARRVAGEPLEQVLGWAEFCGQRFAVEPGVFVPRLRTELLVRSAVAVGSAGDVVLDLCCGVGAVGAAVATALGGVELHAADVDPAAVRCARRNLAGRGTVYEGDLFAALPAGLAGRVDVLVVNAPYVPTAAIALMPPEARDHEARAALDGGPDGLDVHRRVAAGAGHWLAPGGTLLIETSRAQAPGTQALVAAGGQATRVVTDDEVDGTAVVGTAVVGTRG
jgi:release factor glutamine methyltransferase